MNESIIKNLAIALGLALSAVVTLWEKIIRWASESLIPWIKMNLSPKVSKLTADFFSYLDKSIVALRNLAKKAWQTLRNFLLESTIVFEKNSNSQWVRKWTTKMIKVLDNKPSVIVREEEIELDYDDLPSDVREKWIRFKNSNQEIDFADLYDQEMTMDYDN